MIDFPVAPSPFTWPPEQPGTWPHWLHTHLPRLGEELLCESSLLAKFSSMTGGSDPVAPAAAFSSLALDGEDDPCGLLGANEGTNVLKFADAFMTFYHALESHERELRRQNRLHEGVAGLSVAWVLALSKCIYLSVKLSTFPEWESDAWGAEAHANFMPLSRDEVLNGLPNIADESNTGGDHGAKIDEAAKCSAALQQWVEILPRELCTWCMACARGF